MGPQDDLTLAVPPHDIAAEMGVLGSILYDERAATVARNALTVGSFYKLAHQDIYRAMLALQDEQQPVDIIILRDRLARDGMLEKAGGRDYLVELMEAVPHSANVEYYVALVREQAHARRIVEVCLEGMRSIQEKSATPAELALRVQEAVRDIGKPMRGIPTIGEHLLAAQTRIDARARGEVGLQSGIADLDDKIGGFEPGEFIVIAADTSVGKTAFASNIMLHVTRSLGHKALFFSAEVIGQTLAIDLARIAVGFDFWGVENGRLSPLAYEKWTQAKTALETIGLWVDDTPGIAVEDLTARALAMAERQPLSLIVVDYVQLLRTRQRVESETLRLKVISNALKRLAGETRVPVLVLSQVTTGGEQRRTRYTPELEQDADIVIYLEREKEFLAHPEDEQDICTRTVVVHKGRHKGTGWFRVTFDKPILTFRRHDDGRGQEVGGGYVETKGAMARSIGEPPRRQTPLEPVGTGSGVAGGEDGFDVQGDACPF